MTRVDPITLGVVWGGAARRQAPGRSSGMIAGMA